MKKIVIYEGIKYKVTHENYGFSCSRLIINNEWSSRYMDNAHFDNVQMFSDLAKEAIIEYENRKKAEQTFKQWDGKIN